MNEWAKRVKDSICTHFCEEPPDALQALNCRCTNTWVSKMLPRRSTFWSKSSAPQEQILEIGILVWIRSLWLSKARDDTGKLIAIECDDGHCQTALGNIALAGKADQIEVVL